MPQIVKKAKTADPVRVMDPGELDYHDQIALSLELGNLRTHIDKLKSFADALNRIRQCPDNFLAIRQMGKVRAEMEQMDAELDRALDCVRKVS